MPDPASTNPQFVQTWQQAPGLAGWFKEVNNQPLGKRFMVTAFLFFLIGGVLALLMRVQLTVPGNSFLEPRLYNQLFTVHGSTMMYLFAVPFLEGLALYLLPLMIGSRDVAFPRLSALSYWTYLFGGLIFYAGFLFDAAPDAGWFAYTPLSGNRFAGWGLDFWALGLGLVEVAGIAAGAELAVTVLKFRAAGMALHRMPLFAWTILVVAVMMLFAFTTLLVATLMLELDRSAGTRFFSPEHGGSSLLWQHLFWFFGHPEVYIIFLPATGIVSMVVTAFAGRIAGYVLIVVAVILTGFMSFGLWVHHMYTTGLPTLSMNFFVAASLVIAIASGIQIFAWIASLWGSRPALRPPLLWVLGFVFIFVLGGLTGVMIAIVPFDWQVHDSFFIVAHFHYVLIGGAVFPIFAGLYFWVPKITGRMLSHRLGAWSFWLSFAGFNLTFFPMHIMGLLGMPRRVYTYPVALGLTGHNIAASIGAFILAAGFVLFVVDLLRSLRRGAPAGNNPWGGDSLEWSLPSPPPVYAFHAPPEVRSLHPQWTPAPAVTEAMPTVDPTPWQRIVLGLSAAPRDWRGTLSTDVLTGAPQSVQHLPGPTWRPFITSVGLFVTAAAMLAEAYLLAAAGTVVMVAAAAAWLWPHAATIRLVRDSGVDQATRLPVFASGVRATAWWGTVAWLTVLGTALGALIYSYFYIRLYADGWPQGGLPRPALLLPAVAHGLLALAVLPAWWALRAARRHERRRAVLGLGLAMLPLLGFFVLQALALTGIGFSPRSNAYASLFWTVSAALVLLVLATAAVLVAVVSNLLRDEYEQETTPAELLLLHVQISVMFAGFTAVAGGAVYATLHLSPYVL